MDLSLNGLILMAFLALGFVSCNNDDNYVDPIPDSDENIVELATGEPQLENLAAALQRAELVTTLQGDGPFTVLAPTNEAFDDFLSDNGYAGLNDVPVEALKQLLLNHVIRGRFSSVDFLASRAGYTYTLADATLNDDPDAKLNIFYEADDNIEFNDDAEIIQNGTNIGASNGVVHMVDDVIDLPTVATFLEADPAFESLEDALDADGQPDFETILETPSNLAPAPFTVFAPINEAFTALGELPSGDELTAVLQYHVITENNILFSDITDGLESPATLQGDSLTFSKAGNVVDITDGSGVSNSNIIPQLANIQAANGIIHGITDVLLPNTDEDTNAAEQ
ncbi:fasciclin domain-containing protein [Pricia sp. S334]|uniref:Fasciclin domain-containing protein n=1 Tax=Pricia mediterranea TaxID=3076079 RepID=A0ABU3L004_9FLAO|nr:fasciclin domain-containing protein [Pricia sp. S334]MDT7827060.1 fasciclin domain-containing protein [Pricia sp. S334]